MGRKPVDRIYKLSQLVQLSADQKNCLVAVLDKIEQGLNINKSDLDALTDYSKLTNGQICDVLKCTRNYLGQICAKDVSIKNGDGSYSLINAINHIRNGKGSVELNGSDGSIEDKRVVETEILKKKLANLDEKYIERDQIEKILVSRLERLFTYLSTTLNRDLYLLENKTIEQLKPIKDDIIRKAMTAYGDESESGNGNG